MTEPVLPRPLPSSGATAKIELQRHLAHGEAAFVLLESILIALIEQGVIDTDQLLVLIEDAVMSKRAGVDLSRPVGVDSMAAGALNRLANSLMSARPRETGS